MYQPSYIPKPQGHTFHYPNAGVSKRNRKVSSNINMQLYSRSSCFSVTFQLESPYNVHPMLTLPDFSLPNMVASFFIKLFLYASSVFSMIFKKYFPIIFYWLADSNSIEQVCIKKLLIYFTGMTQIQLSS